MKLNRDQIVSPEASSEGSPTDSNSADDEVYVDLPEDDQVTGVVPVLNLQH